MATSPHLALHVGRHRAQTGVAAACRGLDRTACRGALLQRTQQAAQYLHGRQKVWGGRKEPSQPAWVRTKNAWQSRDRAGTHTRACQAAGGRQRSRQSVRRAAAWPARLHQRAASGDPAETRLACGSSSATNSSECPIQSSTAGSAVCSSSCVTSPLASAAASNSSSSTAPRLPVSPPRAAVSRARLHSAWHCTCGGEGRQGWGTSDGADAEAGLWSWMDGRVCACVSVRACVRVSVHMSKHTCTRDHDAVCGNGAVEYSRQHSPALAPATATPAGTPTPSHSRIPACLRLRVPQQRPQQLQHGGGRACGRQVRR